MILRHKKECVCPARKCVNLLAFYDLKYYMLRIINSNCIGRIRVRCFHIFRRFDFYSQKKRISMYSQSSAMENYVRFTEIRKIIPSFERIVLPGGIIFATLSRVRYSIPDGGYEIAREVTLRRVHVRVQRIFRMIVLRLRDSGEFRTRQVTRCCHAFSDYVYTSSVSSFSCRIVIIHGPDVGTVFLANFAAERPDSCTTHFCSSRWQLGELAGRERGRRLGVRHQNGTLNRM